MDAINVVVTCTKDKRHPVPSTCQLGSVKERRLDRKFSEWQERLSGKQHQRYPVHELYAGDHWTTVKRLIATSRLELRVWVCSAGYGLISTEAEVVPYSATFSSNQPDSISEGISTTNGNIAGEWWSLLTRWTSGFGKQPRSLVAIARAFPKSPIVVAASETYLRAIHDDLVGARNHLSNPDLLAILSAGSKQPGDLTSNLVPFDARLQPFVGGALRSLNVRVLEHLLSSTREIPSLSQLKRRVSRIMQSLPEFAKVDRQNITDKDVRRFIEESLEQDGQAKRTRLLRNLRDKGMACEQHRFAALYQEVREQLYGIT